MFKFFGRRLAGLLSKRSGFIFTDTIIIMPILYCLFAGAVCIAGAYIKNFSAYVDMWIMQAETRKVMEDIAAEIEYADEIYCKTGVLNKQELRISTSRRASLINNDAADRVQKYLSYSNEGTILYRNDLAKINDNLYTIKAKQPLNGENYFSTNRVSFTCTEQAKYRYVLEVEGYSYKSKRYFRLKTTVLNRAAMAKGVLR